MGTVSRGGSIILAVQYYESLGGPPTDPQNPTLNIELEADGSHVAGPFTYPTHLSRDGVGEYRYNWAVPSDATLGDYVARWSGTINDSTSEGLETFTVVDIGAVIPSIGITATLGVTKVLEFGGIFDPLFLEPDCLIAIFPDATRLEAAEQIYFYSLEVQSIIGVGVEPSFTALEYIKAAAACALSKQFDFASGDDFGLQLGDLSVTSRNFPKSSVNRANATTWCELAAVLRADLLASRTNMKTVVRGSNHPNPIPSRKLRAFE